MHYYLEISFDNRYNCYNQDDKKYCRSYGIIITSHKYSNKDLNKVTKYNSIIIPITKDMIEEISILEREKLMDYYR